MKTCPNPDCPDLLRSGAVGEYVDSVDLCPRCGAYLVQASPAPGSPASGLPEEIRRAHDAASTPVSVLQTADAGLIALVQSLFDAEGIHYFLKGEGLQDLLGWGRVAGGFNYVVGPAEFMVRAVDAERAGALLADVERASDDAGQSDEDASDEA